LILRIAAELGREILCIGGAHGPIAMKKLIYNGISATCAL
jgi:hypothetical protein